MPNKDYTTQRLLAGTHTSDGEQNYLQIIAVHMPKEDVVMDASRFDDEKGGRHYFCLKGDVFINYLQNMEAMEAKNAA